MALTVTFKGFQDRQLCRSCGFSQIMVNEVGQKTTRCARIGENGGFVSNSITECNAYSVTGWGGIPQKFAEIGWVLETKKGKSVGFLSPLEIREREEAKNGRPSY